MRRPPSRPVSESVVLELEKNEARLRVAHATAARLLVDVIERLLFGMYPRAVWSRHEVSANVYLPDAGYHPDGSVGMITVGRKDGRWSAEYLRWNGEDALAGARRIEVQAVDLRVAMDELLRGLTFEERAAAEVALG